jgi:hypothetical protein
MMEPEEMRQLLCTARRMVRDEQFALRVVAGKVGELECGGCPDCKAAGGGARRRCWRARTVEADIVASQKRLAEMSTKMDDLPINDPETTVWQRVRFWIRRRLSRPQVNPSAADLLA